MAVTENEMAEARARLSRTIDENNITDALTVLDKAVGGLIDLAKGKLATDGISADTVNSPYGSGPGGGGPGTPAGKVTADMVLDAAEEILAKENNPKMKRNKIPYGKTTEGPYGAGSTANFFKAQRDDYDDDEDEEDLREAYNSPQEGKRFQREGTGPEHDRPIDVGYTRRQAPKGIFDDPRVAGFRGTIEPQGPEPMIDRNGRKRKAYNEEEEDDEAEKGWDEFSKDWDHDDDGDDWGKAADEWDDDDEDEDDEDDAPASRSGRSARSARSARSGDDDDDDDDADKSWDFQRSYYRKAGGPPPGLMGGPPPGGPMGGPVPGGPQGLGGGDDEDEDPMANLRQMANNKRSRRSPTDDEDAPRSRRSRSDDEDEDQDDETPLSRRSVRSKRSGSEDAGGPPMQMGYGGGYDSDAESMARSFRRGNIHKSLVSGRNGNRVAEVVEASQELAHMVNVFGSYLEHLSGQIEEVRRDQYNSSAILTDAVSTVVKSQSAIAVGLERMAKSAAVLASGGENSMNKSFGSRTPGVVMNGRVLAEGASLRRSGAFVDETGSAVVADGMLEGRLNKSLVGNVIQEAVIAGEYSARDALRWLTETDSPTSGPVAVYRQLPTKLQERIAQKANEQD